MTPTFDLRIQASIDTLRNCLDCIDEAKVDYELLLIQAKAFKKYTDSFVDFLERQRWMNGNTSPSKS